MTGVDSAKYMSLLLPNEDMMLPFTVSTERTAEKDGGSAGHAQEAIPRASVDPSIVESGIKPASFGPGHGTRGGISGKGRRLGRIASGGSLGIASSAPSGVPAIDTLPQLPGSTALPAYMPLLPESLSGQSRVTSCPSNQECAGLKVSR